MKQKYRLIFILGLVLALSLGTTLFVSPGRVSAACAGGSVAAVPTSLNADGATPSTVTVTTTAGDSVTVTTTPVVLPAGVTASALTGTATGGVFTVTITSTVATSVTFNAVDNTLAGCQIPGSPTVTFVAPPPDAAHTTITASSPVDADGNAISSVTVTLKDAGGNALGGRLVQLAAAPNTGVTIAAAAPGSDTTTGLGVATFTVKSTTPNNVVLTPTDQSNSGMFAGVALPTATVNFTQAPPSGATSTVTADTASVPADGVSHATITVTVKDAGGHVILNPPLPVVVTLTASAGGSSITIGPAPTQNTNASGQAVFTVASTAALSNVVFTASLSSGVGGGGPVAQTVIITFTTPPASAGNSSVSAPAPVSVQADGATFSTIIVTLRDAGNHVVPGKTVQLTGAPGGGVNVSAPGGTTTDSSGQVTFRVTSTSVGAVQFTAADLTDTVTLNGPGQVQTVTFTQPLPSTTQSTVTRTPAVGSINADGVSTVTITVTLRDSGSAGGAIVPGKTVSLAAAPALAGLTITPNPQTDSGNTGIFNFTVTSTTVGGPVVFTATDTTDAITLANTVSVTFAAPPASNALSTVAASITPVAADGIATSTITVTLNDQGNHPTPGKTVSLAAAPNTGVTITPLSGTTNGAGQVAFTVKSTSVNNVVFTATDVTDANMVLTSTATVSFISPAADPAHSTVGVTGSPAPANGGFTPAGVVTITLTAHDAGNNPAVGKLMELVPSTLTGININPGVSNATGAGGVVTWTITGTIAQNVTFTFKDVTDGNIGFVPATGPNPALVQFTADTVGPVNGPNSSISATPTTLNADGAAFSTITVTLKNASQAIVQGKTVTLVPNPNPLPAGVTLSAASGTSNNQGQVTWTLTSTVAASPSFTAQVSSDGVLIPGAVTIIFNAVGSNVSATNSTVTLLGNPAPADGATPITVTVTLRDGAGAVITTGKTVSLSSSNAADVILPASATTNASGVATFTVTSNNAHTSTITATADTTVILSTKPQITFNPLGSTVNANNSTVVVAGSPAQANGTATITVTVTLLDNASAPVAGKVVTLTSVRGSPPDTFTPPTFLTSDAAGQAVFTIKSTTPGSSNVIAKGDNIQLAAQPSFIFNPVTSVVSAANSTIAASPSTVNADGVSTITVTVTLKDAASLPVGGKTVTLSTDRGATDIIAPASVTSDAVTGQATFTVKSGTPGTAILTAVGDTAVVPGVTLSAHPSIGFIAVGGTVDPAQSTISASGSPTSANGTSVITITVTALDNASAPLSGKVVTISSSRGAQDIITTVTGTTNASGQATFTVKSTSAGSPVISATAGGVALTNTATIQFDPVLASTTNSVINTLPTTTIPADGVTAVTIFVTVRDGTGNGIVGKTVTLTTDAGLPVAGLTISPATALTDATGVATFSATSNIAQTVSFRATLGPPDSITITNTQNTRTVTFGTVATQTAISPTASTISASPTIVSNDGTNYSIVTVHVVQNNGAVAAGATVGIFTSVIGPTATPGLTQTTDGSGNAVFQIRDSLAQTVTITATATNTIGTVTLAGSATITFQPGGSTASAGLSTFTTNLSSIPADNNTTATLTATVRNASNQGVPGHTVTISYTPTLSGLTLSTTSAVTDASGSVSVTVKSSAQGGPLTFTATDSSSGIAITQTAQVTFTSSTGGTTGTAAQSGLTSDAASIPADNVTVANLTATVRNSSNGVLSGKTVTISWTPSLSGMTVSPTSAVTDGNGNASFTVRSVTQGGPVTFTATDSTDSITISQTVQISFTAPGTQKVASSTAVAAAAAAAAAKAGATASPIVGGVGTGMLTVPSDGPSIGVVVPFLLCVRTGPGTSYPAIGRLKGRTQVVLLGKNDVGTAKNFPPRKDCQGGRGGATWFMIQLNNGQVGWVSGFYIRIRRLEFRHLPIVDTIGVTQ